MGLSSCRSLLWSCPLSERAQGCHGRLGTVALTKPVLVLLALLKYSAEAWRVLRAVIAAQGRGGMAAAGTAHPGPCSAQRRGHTAWLEEAGTDGGEEERAQNLLGSEGRGWGQGCSAVMEELGQGCSAVMEELGTGMLCRRRWGHAGDAQPLGKPQPWALSVPVPLGGAEPPRCGPGSGPMGGSAGRCPAAQLSRAGAFQATAAPAGSAAPPSRSQTLPGAKSCSIYWPQAELTAAS